MPFLVRDCRRCGVVRVQMPIAGETRRRDKAWELFAVCQACGGGSIYVGALNDRQQKPSAYSSLDLDGYGDFSDEPVRTDVVEATVSEAVPGRVADLYREAAACRQTQRFEAAGAIFRKTIDVATKHLFANDQRLEGKAPANALRSRLKALGQLKILDDDIVELADVAALDGNDAAHDVDPYSAEEAEALEDLTKDLLDRLFVRPARLAAVKAKQVAAGQRQA